MAEDLLKMSVGCSRQTQVAVDDFAHQLWFKIDWEWREGMWQPASSSFWVQCNLLKSEDGRTFGLVATQILWQQDKWDGKVDSLTPFASIISSRPLRYMIEAMLLDCVKSGGMKLVHAHEKGKQETFCTSLNLDVGFHGEHP